MTDVGKVPDHVQASIDARELARRLQTELQCAHGCGPAVASRGGGPAFCAKHDRPRHINPIPDPLRTEPYLRRKYGSMGTPNRTIFDNVVEQKGQRISAARRRQLRDDSYPPETPTKKGQADEDTTAQGTPDGDAAAHSPGGADSREVGATVSEAQPAPQKGRQGEPHALPAPCCDSHHTNACCDPDDCGPCCHNCPTCPTLQRQRTHA